VPSDVVRCLAAAKVRGVSKDTTREVAQRLAGEELVGACQIVGARVNRKRLWGHHLFFLGSSSILEVTILAPMNVRRTCRQWPRRDVCGFSTVRHNRYLVVFAGGDALRFGFVKARNEQSAVLLAALRHTSTP
jgi:hypothetical protein